MKQFKLIKEYPGSPKLGAIAKDKLGMQYRVYSSKGDYLGKMSKDDLTFNEFWEESEVKPPFKYQIVNLLCTEEHILKGGTISVKNNEDAFATLKGPNLKINTVKSLANKNVIFTLGTTVKDYSGKIYTITSFIFDQKENIVVVTTAEDNSFFQKQINLDVLVPVKVLLTSEDKETIIDGDIIFVVELEEEGNYGITKTKADLASILALKILGDNAKVFKNEKNAEEYCLENIEAFSIKDIKECWKETYSLKETIILLKKRIKQVECKN